LDNGLGNNGRSILWVEVVVMNWIYLSIGIVIIGFILWVIVEGRKECARINSKKK